MTTEQKRKQNMKSYIKMPVTVERVIEKVTEEKTEVIDSEGGPITMLGTTVYVQCTSYAYTGELTGVNDKFIELSNPEIVYETGAWSNKKFSTAEKLPTNKMTIFLAQVEEMFTICR